MAAGDKDQLSRIKIHHRESKRWSIIIVGHGDVGRQVASAIYKSASIRQLLICVTGRGDLLITYRYDLEDALVQAGIKDAVGTWSC